MSVIRVGAQCTSTSECNKSLNEIRLVQFQGGSCGLEGCAHDTDCPADSAVDPQNNRKACIPRS